MEVILGDTTLGELGALNSASMQDRCVVLAYDSTARDGHNKPVPTWVDAEEDTACRFKPDPGREVSNGSETVLADAIVRLPLGTSIGSQDRVRITKRFRRSITPLLYEVIGIPAPGATDILVNLRFVRGR
jgi:hypothetical protein